MKSHFLNIEYLTKNIDTIMYKTTIIMEHTLIFDNSWVYFLFRNRVRLFNTCIFTVGKVYIPSQ